MSFLEHMPLPISYIITHDWKYIHGKMSWTHMFLHDMLSMLFILKGRDFVSSGPGWHISHMSYQKKHLIFHCTGCLIRDCYNGLLKTLYNWVVLSPVYHKQPRFFHSSLYRFGGSARSCFNASENNLLALLAPRAEFLRPSRRLFMSGGWFLYEWGWFVFPNLDDWEIEISYL